MGYLINYEVTHLNILYFYNFPCQSPGLISTLENLAFPSPLPSICLIHSFGAFHLKRIKKYKGATRLAKYFPKNVLITNILLILKHHFVLNSLTRCQQLINIPIIKPNDPFQKRWSWAFLANTAEKNLTQRRVWILYGVVRMANSLYIPALQVPS